VKKKRRIANSAETIETVRTGKQRALKEQETKITKMMAIQLDNSGGPRTVTMKSKATSPKKPMKNSVEGKKTVNPPVTKKTTKKKKKTKKIQSINTEEPEVIICE